MVTHRNYSGLSSEVVEKPSTAGSLESPISKRSRPPNVAAAFANLGPSLTCRKVLLSVACCAAKIAGEKKKERTW